MYIILSQSRRQLNQEQPATNHRELTSAKSSLRGRKGGSERWVEEERGSNKVPCPRLPGSCVHQQESQQSSCYFLSFCSASQAVLYFQGYCLQSLQVSTMNKMKNVTTQMITSSKITHGLIYIN